MTKHTEGEKRGNGKCNATFYSGVSSREGNQEAELGEEKALKYLESFFGK